MNNIQQRVLKAQVEGIANAYIYTSGLKGENGGLELLSTLVYVDEAAGIAADWEPRYGPICVWHRCDADAEGAKPHYIFDYVNDGGLNWCQSVVEDRDLRGAFRAGNFAYIFSVLADFVRD